MRLRRIKLLILMLAPALLVLTVLSAPSGSDELNLHKVRKIFLQTERDYGMTEKAIADLNRLYAVLKESLATFGFIVVDSLADADAVMDGETGQWITLDGPDPDAQKYSFHFSLVSSKHNVNWKTEFNIASCSSEPEVDRNGMQKIARNLFQAWKKSARRALKLATNCPN